MSTPVRKRGNVSHIYVNKKIASSCNRTPTSRLTSTHTSCYVLALLFQTRAITYNTCKTKTQQWILLVGDSIQFQSLSISKSARTVSCKRQEGYCSGLVLFTHLWIRLPPSIKEVYKTCLSFKLRRRKKFSQPSSGNAYQHNACLRGIYCWFSYEESAR